LHKYSWLKKLIDRGFLYIDEANLPISSESLDMVVLDSVLEHLYCPMHVLSECLRVLKSNGNLVILTPNQARLKNRFKLLIGGSIYYPLQYWASPSRMWINKRGRKVFAGHIREYTPSEVRKMIESAGFRIRSSKLTTAQHISGLDPALGSNSADAIESRLRSRGALFLYNCAETAYSPWRTTIITIATKVCDRSRT
jgi:SAM-dependent methyltransferase